MVTKSKLDELPQVPYHPKTYRGLSVYNCIMAIGINIYHFQINKCFLNKIHQELNDVGVVLYVSTLL